LEGIIATADKLSYMTHKIHMTHAIYRAHPPPGTH
jgi:hypothetical protein